MASVTVIGLGKLGAPLAAVLSDAGHNVWAVDDDLAKVEAVNSGRAPVLEPGLDDLIAGQMISAVGHYGPVAGADATFIVVPTPSRDDGTFSNRHLLDAVEQIGLMLRGRQTYHLVVVVSTVMPGTTGGDVTDVLERSSGRAVGRTLGLCYSPEFIALGSVIEDLHHPDMVMVGASDDRAGDLLADILSPVVEPGTPFVRMSIVDAEIAKLAVNAFVTMKISFANQVGEMCGSCEGADAVAVTRAVGLDLRIGGAYLTPATAFGGPCFPRDSLAFRAFARNLGLDAPLAEATDRINSHQVLRLVEALDDLVGFSAPIGILGLSYKPGTPVTEDSVGLALARQFGGGRPVLVCDPIARPELPKGAEQVELEDLLRRVEAVVITTPWPEFARDYDIPVIDCWGIARGPGVLRLGRDL